jgi:tRNA uridine 5-carbamoylmethylation protein Kti12
VEENMKLIFIYGSPAVGKLTVSNELARLTNYKVFHNHLTVDAILPIFDFGSPPFTKLNDEFRKLLIAEAVSQDVDLITTYCYAKGLDDERVEELLKLVEENGGEVNLVLLTCERKELETRVLAESRQNFEKVKTVELLDEVLDKYELFSTIPNRESLVIDNTNLSAEMVAKQIIEHLKL